MPLNLLTDAWLPVRLHDGSRSIIRPAQIVENLKTEKEAVFPDWPRPDLNIATLELLIGLLSVAMPPKMDEEWSEVWESPPTTAKLDEAFEPYISAFNLDSDGPRFCQDFEELEGETGDLNGLFIDAAGDSTIKKNADLMVKRGRYTQLSRASAAITLYALQQFAPSGGAGHRTSMRGGGPLTTLAIPPGDQDDTPALWSIVWANVMVNENGSLAERDVQKVFPWLAPTITSKKGEELHENDPRAHKLQTFFGMPRRIRLNFENNNQRMCDLNDMTDTKQATGYVTRPHGTNYGQWRHPLTPYYRKKADDIEYFATHPGAGPLGYRNWVSIVLGDENQTRDPAACITAYRRNGRYDAGEARIVTAGWAMSNMKPLDFIYDEQPLHLTSDPVRQGEIDNLARQMVKAADAACGYMAGAIQDALKAGGNRPKHDSTIITATKESFFADTENKFHDLLGIATRTTESADDPLRDLREDWLKTLQQTALALFDNTIQPDPSDPQKARQVVEARKKLTRNLFYLKGEKSLSGLLGLPDPIKTKGQLA